MLIRILLKNGGEEGLFNADCRIVLLLDAIKQKHGIPRKEEIDLCTVDAEIKYLNQRGSDNGKSFFTFKEVCLVVLVSEISGQTVYTPALSKYADNEDFVGMLNYKPDTTSHKSASVQPRVKHRLSTKTTPAPGSPSKSPKAGAKTLKKRRQSSNRFH
ncbi:uncharacterized protein LOC135340964 [Halichondria panicea]|uniref:uncharacterized protein LOC135340964 n=1 Tax=Halichondria panicea TaxID=6063 RepID=UPI00312B5700